MVLDSIGSSLRKTLDKVKGALFVDESLVNEIVKDIQRALLQADVNVQLVFDLTQNIKERALNEKAPGTLSKKDYLVTIVYEELVKFLGGEGHKITVDAQPTVVMLVGLFGAGKTTTAGKIAKFFKTRGYKPALVSLDTWRPAAYKQLKMLGEQIKVDVYGDPDGESPAAIYEQFEDELQQYDLVVVDTAGRDALNDELVEELSSIQSAVHPHETLLVLSADIGQGAQKQAQMFHETCGVTGVVVTKLEGTAKGGGALVAAAATDAPIKFIGVGEHVNDLEEFDPERFVGKLLGMGDLEGLLEKARHAFSEEEAEDLQKRFLKGEYNLLDLYEQMQAMQKMGPLSKIMDMIPGMGKMKLPKDAVEVQQEKLELWRIAMDSMTQEELEEPKKISGSRVERIAQGAGVGTSDVRDLLKQYKQSKKLVKMMKGGRNMQDMMKQFAQ